MFSLQPPRHISTLPMRSDSMLFVSPRRFLYAERATRPKGGREDRSPTLSSVHRLGYGLTVFQTARSRPNLIQRVAEGLRPGLSRVFGASEMACGFVQCGCRTTASQGFGLRSSSGSWAMLAAMRRASSRVNSRCANGCGNGRFSALDEAQNSYAESDCNPARRYRKAGPVHQRAALNSGRSRSAGTVGLSPRQPGSSDPLQAAVYSHRASSLTMGTIGTCCANICWCSG
jgi:hypothetical protein